MNGYDGPSSASSTDTSELGCVSSRSRRAFSCFRRLPAIMSLERPSIFVVTNEIMSPHRLLIASFLPILRAGLTASARFTFPISLRFNFDGLGSFSIHSGTGEPDWRRTFAMLFHRIRE